LSIEIRGFNENQQHVAGSVFLSPSQTAQIISRSLQLSLQKGIKHRQHGNPTNESVKAQAIVTKPTFLRG